MITRPAIEEMNGTIETQIQVTIKENSQILRNKGTLPEGRLVFCYSY